jgi:hypothetical protein
MFTVHRKMTFLQVKEPSDLGTVCSRVQRQGFETLQQVNFCFYEDSHFSFLQEFFLTFLQWVRDIDLIWANALLCVRLKFRCVLLLLDPPSTPHAFVLGCCQSPNLSVAVTILPTIPCTKMPIRCLLSLTASERCA